MAATRPQIDRVVDCLTRLQLVVEGVGEGSFDERPYLKVEARESEANAWSKVDDAIRDVRGAFLMRGLRTTATGEPHYRIHSLLLPEAAVDEVAERLEAIAG